METSSNRNISKVQVYSHKSTQSQSPAAQLACSSHEMHLMKSLDKLIKYAETEGKKKHLLKSTMMTN